MECLLPSLKGMVSNIVARFERDLGKSGKCRMGSLRSHIIDDKTTGVALAASRLEGGMKTGGIWPSTLDALPETEFAEGISPEADSGEFSDDLWRNRSHSRLREDHVATADQRESSGLIRT